MMSSILGTTQHSARTMWEFPKKNVPIWTKYTMILAIGAPTKEPLILGNTHMNAVNICNELERLVGAGVQANPTAREPCNALPRDPMPFELGSRFLIVILVYTL